jgi:hypothetical protein
LPEPFGLDVGGPGKETRDFNISKGKLAGGNDKAIVSETEGISAWD